MLKEFMLFEVLGLSSGDVNDSSFFLKNNKLYQIKTNNLLLMLIYTPSNLSESGLFTIIETGLKPEVFLAAAADDIFWEELQEGVELGIELFYWVIYEKLKAF